MLAATDFATTPSGYITPVLIAVLITVTGYSWRRNDHRLDRQDESLSLLNQSNAVLVAQLAPLQLIVDSHNMQIADLKTSTALLKSTLERHEAWHERQERGSHGT